jgi:single stranded DNA-binding protein
MAIVATLNEAENRHAPSAYSIASIPLNKLVRWDGNVRKTNAADGIEQLAANIAGVGLLQSLVVRKTNRGKYAIIAGRRRFRALSLLAEAGTIAPDAPVPCRIVPGAADPTEIGLSENVMRAPMHPADQFEAFRALIDDGSSPADIAARFGISETAVKQRLKLARVSPVVFEAYRAVDLDLEQVQAFAVSDDTQAQERIFKEVGSNTHPSSIRRALTQGEIMATDKRVRFVTFAAYEEAGGAVRRDLLAEGDDGVFILDAELLDRLAREKLEAEAERAACFPVPQDAWDDKSNLRRTTIYMNQLTIIGFTGQDAEFHSTSNRTPVATISAATKESWKNEQGDWQRRAEWHRVVAFGKLGEYAKTLVKGSHVLVQGALRSREYEKDGVKHRVVELRADAIGKLDRSVRREEGEPRSEEA